MKESVITVDPTGGFTGTMDKMAAHRKGRLHRAFSVFIFNLEGKLLLQQRAIQKYHSGGLWTNTCCSHPRPGEDTLNAAGRRLREEMGMEAVLTELFSFSYRHVFENGLIEYEYDHVLIGFSDTLPEPDPAEVAAWKQSHLDALLADLTENPDNYTPWFKICLPRVIESGVLIKRS